MRAINVIIRKQIINTFHKKYLIKNVLKFPKNNCKDINPRIIEKKENSIAIYLHQILFQS